MFGKTHTEEVKKRLSEFNKGKIMSDETKEKISIAAKGENNPMYGLNHTDETRQKMRANQNFSEARLKILSEFSKPKYGEKNGFFGKTHSEKTKKQIATIRKGKKPKNSQKVERSDGKIYESLADAIKDNKTNHHYMRQHIEGVRININGFTFILIKKGDKNESS